jgi:tetratricopeptide (TPR) repeat protein
MENRTGTREHIINGIILAAVVLFAYINSTYNEFIWDDNIILENPFIRGLKFIPDMFSTDYWYPMHKNSGLYRPLTTISFAINYAVGGYEVAGYHIGNILLHAGNTLLVYAFVFAFIKKRLAFTTALLFGLHPVHTEVVTWVVGRAELLGTFFFLLGLTAYAASIDGVALSRKKGLAIAGVSYALAVLCKESAVTLPLFTLAYSFFLGGSSRSAVKKLDVPMLMVFAAIAAVYAGIRYSIFGAVGPVMGGDFFYGYSRYSVALTMLKVASYYLLLLSFPAKLKAHYDFGDFSVPSGLLEFKVILAILFLGAIVYLIARSWNSNRTLSFGLLIFFLGLVPVSNIIIEIESLAAERFLYIPSIGYCLALASVIAMISDERGGKGLLVRLGLRRSVLILISVFYVWITIERNELWGDEYRFFNRMVRESPNYADGHVSLGTALMANGDISAALEQFRIASVKKAYNAEAYSNMGAAYAMLGNRDEAQVWLRKALEINPALDKARYNLGTILKDKGDAEAAYKEFAKAVRANQYNIHAALELGMILEKSRKYDKAREMYERYLRYVPDDSKVQVRLACTFASTGSEGLAAGYLRQALLGGYSDLEELGKEECLKNMLSSAEFKPLVDRLLKEKVKREMKNGSKGSGVQGVEQVDEK